MLKKYIQINKTKTKKASSQKKRMSTNNSIMDFYNSKFEQSFPNNDNEFGLSYLTLIEKEEEPNQDQNHLLPYNLNISLKEEEEKKEFFLSLLKAKLDTGSISSSKETKDKSSDISSGDEIIGKKRGGGRKKKNYEGEKRHTKDDLDNIKTKVFTYFLDNLLNWINYGLKEDKKIKKLSVIKGFILDSKDKNKNICGGKAKNWNKEFLKQLMNKTLSKIFSDKISIKNKEIGIDESLKDHNKKLIEDIFINKENIFYESIQEKLSLKFNEAFKFFVNGKIDEDKNYKFGLDGLENLESFAEKMKIENGDFYSKKIKIFCQRFDDWLYNKNGKCVHLFKELKKEQKNLI